MKTGTPIISPVALVKTQRDAKVVSRNRLLTHTGRGTAFRNGTPHKFLMQLTDKQAKDRLGGQGKRGRVPGNINRLMAELSEKTTGGPPILANAHCPCENGV